MCELLLAAGIQVTSVLIGRSCSDVYRLIATGTLEENMYERQRKPCEPHYKIK